MADVSKYEVKVESFEKLLSRLRYNEDIATHYEEYSKELRSDGLYGLEQCAERMRDCSSYWELLEWATGIRSVEGTQRCKDKFCVNCQNVLAQARVREWTPKIDCVAFDSDVYHCVFTVKNCPGGELRKTVERMYKSFSRLMEFFIPRADADGKKMFRKRIKGITFDFLDCHGGVRSLEVTYNKSDDEYHPHLHCLLVFSKDLELEQRKYVVNAFSYNKDGKLKQNPYFSEEEILFQKIWFLLNTGVKVNKENIDNVELGYSVKMTKAQESDYKEVFKYALKEDLERDKCLEYEQFKVYREQLKGIRFVQGVGELYNFDFDDSELTVIEEDEEYAFNEEKAVLTETYGDPEKLRESFRDMVTDMKSGKHKYIMSNKSRRFVDGTDDLLDRFREKVKEENKKQKER